jgi:transposase
LGEHVPSTVETDWRGAGRGAHEHAFAYFGGVFRLLRYDNLASAVCKILRGYRREDPRSFPSGQFRI